MANADHKRFNIVYDPATGTYAVHDKWTDTFAGHSQTEQGARHLRRNVIKWSKERG